MTGFHLENSTIILRARIILSEPGEAFFLLLKKVSSDRVKEGMEKIKMKKKKTKTSILVSKDNGRIGHEKKNKLKAKPV